MDDLLLKSGADWITVVASREEVERLDFFGCLRVLNSLIESRARVMKFRDRVDFGVKVPPVLGSQRLSPGRS
jgi:hypothetical protein